MPKSPSRNSAARFELFAVAAPGLESITAGELKTLGLRGKREAGSGTREAGGVSFAGDLEAIYRANLWLRTATRVLLRLGSFHASTFYELERRAKKLDWAAFLPATGSVEVRVTCRKSRLYHSDAVAERILSAIARVAPSGLKIVSAGNEDVESEDADARETGKAALPRDPTVSSQSFVVRIVDDQCEISADTSGELLHRRGYRLETAKAPVRETLAAAMVLASGWKGSQPLLDPMCGSGTIPIEAAMIACRTAPGLNRRFQFMNWASFDRGLWNEILGKAKDSIITPALRIHGSDRDPGAIESATRNAERAGVTSDIQFSTESVSGAFAGLEDVADGEGWIITNPPYGVRVGESADLRNLYATLGNSLKAKAGWRVGVLAAEDALAGQMRLPMRSRFESRNGGIPVRFLVSERIEHGIAPAIR